MKEDITAGFQEIQINHDGRFFVEIFYQRTNPGLQ